MTTGSNTCRIKIFLNADWANLTEFCRAIEIYIRKTPRNLPNSCSKDLFAF